MKRLSLNDYVKELLDENMGWLAEREKSDVCSYSVLVNTHDGSIRSLLGLVNIRNGELITEPRFSYVGDFYEGIAVCKINEKVGFIRESGSYFVEPSAEYVDALPPISGVCMLKEREGWVLLDISGKKLSENSFDTVQIVNDSRVNLDVTLFNVKKGDKVGIIRSDGVWLFPIEEECFSVVGYNWLVAVKKDGTECLFDVASNKLIINDVKHITNMGEGYISYHTKYDGECFAYVENGKVKVLLRKYDRYRWLNAHLVVCSYSVGKNDILDIFDVKTFKVIVKDINDITETENMTCSCWYIYKSGYMGLLSEEGIMLINCVAENIAYADSDKMRAKINGFEGLYNLRMRNWTVLPQYLKILGPDEEGFFRGARELLVSGKVFEKKRRAWYYMREDGSLITKENFAKGSGFVNNFAKVEDFEGYTYLLGKDGSLTEQG